MLQNPNPDHPYGYTNMKYVSSLISGVGIFCVGTGLSIYHGIHGLLFPAPLDSLFWAYFVLGGSLLSEGATLMMALHSIMRGAEEKKESLKQFVLEGQDPSVNVVLMEDFAAVSLFFLLFQISFAFREIPISFLGTWSHCCSWMYGFDFVFRKSDV